MKTVLCICTRKGKLVTYSLNCKFILFLQIQAWKPGLHQFWNLSEPQRLEPCGSLSTDLDKVMKGPWAESLQVFSSLQMRNMSRRQRKALRKLKQRINLLLMLSRVLQKSDMLDLSNRLLLHASLYHLLKEGLKVELPAWSEQNYTGTDSSCRFLNIIQVLKYWSKFFPFLTPTIYLFLKTYR